MTLDEALQFAHQKYLEGHKSDGCTYAPDLGIKKFCYMHDFLIRFRRVSRLEADNLFFKGITSKGPRYLPVAVIYWLAVRWVAATGGQPGPSFGLAAFLLAVAALALITS